MLSGNFFSYADQEDHYWTSYYLRGLSTRTWTASWKHTCGETARFRLEEKGSRGAGLAEQGRRAWRPRHREGEGGGGVGLAERVGPGELCGRRPTCLSGQGAEILYSLAVAHARRAGLASQFPLSNFALLTDGSAHTGALPAPAQCRHRALTGGLWGQVGVPPLPHPLLALPTIPSMRMPGGGGLACWGLALPVGGQSLSGHLSPGPSPAHPPRLLRSLVSLKQVIMNAAHYLVLGDKKAYHFDPGCPSCRW